jgi:hypothetical protein
VEAVVNVEGQAAVVEGSQGGVLNLADGGNGVSDELSSGEDNIVLMTKF